MGAHQPTCDKCLAGIRLRGRSIKTCPDCLLFETDDDAAFAVQVMLEMLDVEYASADGSVGDAMDRILDSVKGAAEVRENMRQLSSMSPSQIEALKLGDGR